MAALQILKSNHFTHLLHSAFLCTHMSGNISGIMAAVRNFKSNHSIPLNSALTNIKSNLSIPLSCSGASIHEASCKIHQKLQGPPMHANQGHVRWRKVCFYINCWLAVQNVFKWNCAM